MQKGNIPGLKYILEQFEKEVGYKFRPEYIIDQGYMNNTYRVPTDKYFDRKIGRASCRERV